MDTPLSGDGDVGGAEARERRGGCAPRPGPGPAAMRKFFQEIKADLKFKTAGPGQKLSEPSRYGGGGREPSGNGGPGGRGAVCGWKPFPGGC